MKIGIRADGGSKIGMGHIMRTLVLAKELAKTNDVFFICKTNGRLNEKYTAGINKVKNEGFKVSLVNEKNIIEGLKQISADMLITDSYDVNEEYFNETKKIFNKIMYIDDNNTFDYYNIDILLNQNIGAENFNYNTQKTTKLLVGSKFTMLREEFRNEKNIDIRKEVKDIMITVGGSDSNHITEKLLAYVKEMDYKFHVVIGPSFDEISELKEIEKKNKNIKLYFNADMLRLMKKCDLAISSCGSTLYELCYLGIPTLGVIVAENQEILADNMGKSGAIVNLGWYSKLDEGCVRFCIELMNNNLDLRREISSKQIVLIDGQGINRIIEDIFNII